MVEIFETHQILKRWNWQHLSYRPYQARLSSWDFLLGSLCRKFNTEIQIVLRKKVVTTFTWYSRVKKSLEQRTLQLFALSRVSTEETKIQLFRNHMNFQWNGALNVAQRFTKSHHMLLSFSPLFTAPARALRGCSTSEDTKLLIFVS